MRAALSTPLLVLLALALPTLALAFGLPSHPRILAVLNDAAHVPVFGALAFTIHEILRRETRLSSRTRLAASFCAALAAGFLVEAIQPAMGRAGELSDLWTDALGAAAGLAAAEMRSPGNRPAAAAVLVATLGASAWPVAEAGLAYWERYRQAPALLEMDSQLDWFFIRTHGFRAGQAQLPDAWRRPGDPASVRLQFEAESWRMLAVTEPSPDWRRYGYLAVDVTNPAARPLSVTLRVHDELHNHERDDRFNCRIEVPAGSRALVEIPVAEIAAAPSGRQMDLSRISSVILFAGSDPTLTGQAFFVTRLWLERSSSFATEAAVCNWRPHGDSNPGRDRERVVS